MKQKTVTTIEVPASVENFEEASQFLRHSLDAKDTAKAREYIRQARAELGKSAPADMKAPEGDATGVLADTARDFLKNTLKKLME